MLNAAAIKATQCDVTEYRRAPKDPDSCRR